MTDEHNDIPKDQQQQSAEHLDSSEDDSGEQGSGEQGSGEQGSSEQGSSEQGSSDEESSAVETIIEQEDVTLASSEGSNRRWYVIHAYSGYEAYVKDALIERIKLHGAESKFGDILVPKEKVIEMRQGQKRESERKYFPGYVLVHMEMDDETWHLVKKVPKVLGFIGGTSDRPAPISDREAATILNQVEKSSHKPQPKTAYAVGEVVRVIDGPFADFNGVVEEVNYEKSRLRVAVLIFGRSTPVELEFSQVEKA